MPKLSDAVAFGHDFYHDLPTDRQLKAFLKETGWTPGLGSQGMLFSSGRMITTKLTAGGINRKLWKKLFARDVPTHLFPELKEPEPEKDATVADALSPRYFPMKVGHKWVYAYEDKEVTIEVLRTEKSRGVTVYVLRRSLDKHHVEYKLAVEDSGVYFHEEGKKAFSPPLRRFAFLPRTGDTWKWRGFAGDRRDSRQFEHGGVDKVTVPAGSYSAIRIHTKAENGEHATCWLAEGVGIVRWSGWSELFDDTRVLFEWNLKRFHKGKE
jgi:hypothetical protein